jgi:hypothetical protein
MVRFCLLNLNLQKQEGIKIKSKIRKCGKEKKRSARAPTATCGAHVLVCLAGGVNYRDERNPTGAMTPTVVEG